MICFELSVLCPIEHLKRGNRACEPARGELNACERPLLQAGKEASIAHMLAGGNGFPASHFTTHLGKAAFDAGCTIERRDLRSMQVWSRDLSQALADRKRGRIDG